MEKKYFSITLRHLIIDKTQMIWFKYIYNSGIHAIIESMDNVKWSEAYALNYTLNSKSNLKKIVRVFKGEAG